MAVNFPLNSLQYVSFGSAILTAPPFSVAVWFNVSAYPSIAYTLFAIDRTGSVGGFRGFEYFRLYLDTQANGAVVNARRGGPGLNFSSATKGPYSLNTWQLAIAIFATQSSVFAGLDGILGTEDTANIAPNPAALTDTFIGSACAGGGGFFAGLSGCAAHVSVWNNHVLSADERAALAGG